MNLHLIKRQIHLHNCFTDGGMKQFSKIAQKATVGALSVLLAAGCASHALRTSFSDYSEVYADAQNRQMLLNLARLSQHHPTYFFQLGQINASYNYTTSATAAGGQSDKSALSGSSRIPLINWIVASISGTASRSSSPTFTYVPLSGGDFAAHLITPLVPDTFHALFREGVPVDLLMRTLVQEIHFTPYGDTNEMVIYNMPSSNNKTNYARFLRLCGALRSLQEQGYLPQRVRKQTEHVIGPDVKTPKAKDLIDAAVQKLTWQRTTSNSNAWHLERVNEVTNSPHFEIPPEATNCLNSLDYPPYQTNEINDLKALLGPENSASNAPLVQLRSFLFVLADMADEQAAFDVLKRDPYFTNNVPKSQLRPILRMDWSGESRPLEAPLVKLTYQGKVYQITDYKESAESHHPANGWNRDAFRNRDAFMLATTLATQIMVDPAKINYQLQFLQVR
ncbi:MAG: hypothetical protein ABSD29_07980 [Verrucomicrobiota bacterium]|jgi:hypothetical protein